MKLQRLLTSAAVVALMAGSAAAQTMTPNADGSTQAPIVAPMYHSIDEMTVGDVIGTFVYSPDGDAIGEIDYVVEQGDTIAAVIGIGGFIGLGEYTVALPMDQFKLREDGISFELAAEKEALKELPEFDETGAESLDSELLIAELMPAREGDGVDSAAMDAPTPAPMAVTTAGEEVANAASEVGTAVEETGEEIASDAGTALEITGEEIADTASDVGTAVEETGEEMASDAVTALENSGEEIAQTASDVGMAVEETSEEIANAAEEAVDGAETAIDEAGEEMASDLPESDLPMTDGAPSDLNQMTVGEVIGTVAYDHSGNKIGEIDYVIVPASGPAAVIGIGGFIGLGEYTVALPIDQFKLSDDGTFFTLATDKETLKAQPEFDESGVESVDYDLRIGDLKKLKVDATTVTN